MKFSSVECLLPQEFDDDFGHLVNKGSCDLTGSHLLSTERSQHNAILDDFSTTFGICSSTAPHDESNYSHEIDWEEISRKLLNTPIISEVNEVLMSNMNIFYDTVPTIGGRLQDEYGLFSNDMLDNDLFGEEFIKKRKFRLLINPDVENWIRAEYQQYSSDLGDMIEMKWHSLSIPVKITEYIRADKDKTNDKAFIIVFENYWDVQKAFNLVESGKLPFPMREARPSPSYHVKYEVLQPTTVFEGKCFIQRLGEELHKGDVVTANQLKGNKLRIIKCIRFGSDIEYALHGWVLLRHKHTDFLRVIGQLTVEIPTCAGGRPWNNTEEVVGSPRKITQKAKPQRVSAAKCSPFKVLTELKVFNGRKEPTVVGLLTPGSMVWANQHKGSMLRIVKMDEEGSIKLDRQFKPEVWGWVCLKRKVDETPRLERISGLNFDTTKATPRSREEERNNYLNIGNNATKGGNSRKKNAFNMYDAREAMEFKPKGNYQDQANSWPQKNGTFTQPQVQSSPTYSLTSPGYMRHDQNNRKLVNTSAKRKR